MENDLLLGVLSLFVLICMVYIWFQDRKYQKLRRDNDELRAKLYGPGGKPGVKPGEVVKS